MAKFNCTVKGGLFAQFASTLPSIEANNIIYDHRRAAQMLAHKGDFEARTLLNALAGAAPGANAQYIYAEISPNVEMGGKRVIQQTNLINRATTAADATDIKTEIGALSTNSHTVNQAVNKDRNPLGTR
jgi:hypothetical protein